MVMGRPPVASAIHAATLEVVCDASVAVARADWSAVASAAFAKPGRPLRQLRVWLCGAASIEETTTACESTCKAEATALLNTLVKAFRCAELSMRTLAANLRSSFTSWNDVTTVSSGELGDDARETCGVGLPPMKSTSQPMASSRTASSFAKISSRVAKDMRALSITPLSAAVAFSRHSQRRCRASGGRRHTSRAVCINRQAAPRCGTRALRSATPLVRAATVIWPKRFKEC
mmetsp:Transcript_42075/g.116219  ORF Transcript_42075/g.116219 Transcript_42075/m.116219 type:complete len:232 (+) Transcript_42075:646-1341(+)